MPIGDWYSLTEVGRETQLSYHQVLNWVRRHLRAPSPPTWVQRTTKGIMVQRAGIGVLRREHPAAKPSGTRGGGE